MREIDAIANEKFNGNTLAAIEHLVRTLGKGEFGRYVHELTPDEAKFVLDLIHSENVKAVGGEQEYNKLLKREEQLLSMNLTYEQVRDATGNPYKTKLLLAVLSFLLIEGGLAVLLLLKVDFHYLSAIVSFCTGLLSLNLASNIVNYIKFRHLKESIDKENFHGR